MCQTIVGKDMSFYSIRFRVPSCRFTVGYAKKWLAIKGGCGKPESSLGRTFGYSETRI
jgi:hypothetical protein